MDEKYRYKYKHLNLKDIWEYRIELLSGTLVKDDFSIESEMTQILNDQDLRFANVEINCKYGDFDTSTKNPWRHGL